MAFGENRASIAIALGEAAERGEALTVPEAQDHTDVSSTTVRNILKNLADGELVEETTKGGRLAFRMTEYGLQGFRTWRDEHGTVPARERQRELFDRLAGLEREHLPLERAEISAVLTEELSELSDDRRAEITESILRKLHGSSYRSQEEVPEAPATGTRVSATERLAQVWLADQTSPPQ